MPVFFVRTLGVLLSVALVAFVGGCSKSSPPISLLVSPSSSQIDQSQTLKLTASLTNDRSNAGVDWSLSGPGTLTATTGTSVIYNSPKIAIDASQQAIITAISVADKQKSASARITVNPYPQIPLQTLSSGTVGMPYNQTIALTGGTSPFQWGIYDGPILTGWRVGGAIPDGLKLDSNTGQITGTPTGAGTWYFEAIMTDAAGASVSNNFLSIEIRPSASASAHPVPFLNQVLVPTTISPGGVGWVLNVSGVGFVAGATIVLNGASQVTSFVDDRHLTATVSGTSLLRAQTAVVTVVNPGPGGGSSNAVNLQIGAPESTISFAAPVNLQLANHLPTAVTVGDFNEDGKPGLAVSADLWAHIFLGNGDGTFTPSPASPVIVASPPFNDAATPLNGPLVAGDFNHSGHLGLAIVDEPNAAAYILLGHGDGTFAPSSAAFAQSSIFDVAIAAADFNGDGNLDLAFENGVSLGYGDGAFSPAGGLSNTGLASGIALGDFNQDGKLDAVVASGGSATYPDSGLSISLGKGDGTFAPASNSPMMLGNSLSAVVAADFNGDGKLDLAATDAGSNTVWILLGNGDGTFTESLRVPTGSGPETIAVGDFNNDGALDLVIGNFEDGTVSLLLGDGKGAFQESSGSPYPVGKGPISLAAADFNQDGKLDLAVVNLTDRTVSILLQQ